MEIYPVLQGWLTKSPPENKLHGKIFKAKWRRRYFVLYVIPPNTSAAPGPQGALVYFDSEQKKKRRGAIELNHCEEVQSSLHYLEFQYLFSVRSKHQGRDRTYFLAADTEHEMIRWVDCLCVILGFKEDTGLFSSNVAAVSMPAGMSSSDFSVTGHLKVGPQLSGGSGSHVSMPAIQAGTVGHLLQQQLGRDGAVPVPSLGGGMVATSSGVIIPQSLLPAPPEKVGQDARVRKVPLSAEMEQQAMQTYNVPGMTLQKSHRPNGKSSREDDTPPPLPQPRKTPATPPVRDDTYDTPPPGKSGENLGDTYDTPPPVQSQASAGRASADETYDRPPPQQQKPGKSKKPPKTAVDDDTYDKPPPNGGKQSAAASRVESSDSTYDTPPPTTKKDKSRASADDTYDAPPKGKKEPTRGSTDNLYDAPPKGKKEPTRGSTDNLYDAPPKKDTPKKAPVEVPRKSTDETYDSPPVKSAAKDSKLKSSTDNLYDAPPKQGPASQSRDTSRATAAGDDTEYDSPKVRLPKKTKPKDSKVDDASQPDADATPADQSAAQNSKVNRISGGVAIELPQASRGIFFTSKSHSFRKDLSKPPVLPKRFEQTNAKAADGASDSSDDSDTSSKSVENLIKVGVGGEVVETTKTGPVQLMPTLAETEGGECVSPGTPEAGKKKKKPEKPEKPPKSK